MSSVLITKHEGFSESPYLCPAGKPTIGYGTRFYEDGREVTLQDEPITRDYAEALLNDYLIKNVYPIFPTIPYRLTEGQKEAIASLVYNVGAPAFLKSKLYKAIRDKDWQVVFREWDFAVKSGHKGLIKRRAEELALFLKDI